MRKPAAGKYPDEIIRFIGNQIHAPLNVTIIPGRTLGDLVKYLLTVHVDIYMHRNKKLVETRGVKPRTSSMPSKRSSQLSYVPMLFP